MGTRVRIPLVVVIWLVVGIFVAVNKGYDSFDDADAIGTFVLAVVLWPIPATGGGVLIDF